MEIITIKPFLQYYEKIRARTVRVIEVIPPDHIDWAPMEGKLSFGDIIRHIAAVERFFYVEVAWKNRSLYQGYGKDLADGYGEVLNFLRTTHLESGRILNIMDAGHLNSKCSIPMGGEITVWKWLRLMVEHEIHHRAHIYSNLGILGIKTPPIFGKTEPELRS
jgi:uncharacterized damage-inducible protein DinB